LKSGSLRNVVARAADKFKSGTGGKKLIKKPAGGARPTQEHAQPADGTASSKSLSDDGGPKPDCAIEHIDEDVDELSHSSHPSSSLRDDTQEPIAEEPLQGLGGSPGLNDGMDGG